MCRRGRRDITPATAGIKQPPPRGVARTSFLALFGNPRANVCAVKALSPLVGHRIATARNEQSTKHTARIIRYAIK